MYGLRSINNMYSEHAGKRLDLRKIMLVIEGRGFWPSTLQTIWCHQVATLLLLATLNSRWARWGYTQDSGNSHHDSPSCQNAAVKMRHSCVSGYPENYILDMPCWSSRQSSPTRNKPPSISTNTNCFSPWTSCSTRKPNRDAFRLLDQVASFHHTVDRWICPVQVVLYSPPKNHTLPHSPSFSPPRRAKEGWQRYFTSSSVA